MVLSDNRLRAHLNKRGEHGHRARVHDAFSRGCVSECVLPGSGGASEPMQKQGGRWQTFDDQGPLPPGWKTRIDTAKNRRCHYNCSTRQTQ